MSRTAVTRDAAAPERADVALVSRGVVKSRALAQRLIDAGAVDLVVDGRVTRISRRAQPVLPDQSLQVRASAEARYASRGGAKLAHALEKTGIDCRGRTALDAGLSTGGFTDCLLEAGAAGVIGIEVGHGQLDPRLAADPRVTCFERIHIRDVTPDWLAGNGIGSTFSLIVADLSFISTIGLLGHLAGLAAPGADLLALIKPQFELGPHARNARGVVRADADIAGLRERAWQAAQQAGWQPAEWFASALAGTDGNQEYFLYAKRTVPHAEQSRSAEPRGTPR